jgi:hypothetical protein
MVMLGSTGGVGSGGGGGRYSGGPSGTDGGDREPSLTEPDDDLPF